MLRTLVLAGVLAASAGLAHAEAANPAQVDIAVKVDLAQPKAARAALRLAARKACEDMDAGFISGPIDCYNLALSDALDKLNAAERAQHAQLAGGVRQTASR